MFCSSTWSFLHNPFEAIWFKRASADARMSYSSSCLAIPWRNSNLRVLCSSFVKTWEKKFQIVLLGFAAVSSIFAFPQEKPSNFIWRSNQHQVHITAEIHTKAEEQKRNIRRWLQADVPKGRKDWKSPWLCKGGQKVWQNPKRQANNIRLWIKYRTDFVVLWPISEREC